MMAVDSTKYVNNYKHKSKTEKKVSSKTKPQDNGPLTITKQVSGSVNPNQNITASKNPARSTSFPVGNYYEPNGFSAKE
jgi:hypothetical protein